jgi:hypothetical protein
MDDGEDGEAARRVLYSDLTWAAPAHLFVELTTTTADAKFADASGF